MPTKLLSATIDVRLAEKLDRLAQETHRKKSYFVNRALQDFFEEIEDQDIALTRMSGKTVSLKQAKKELGL